jgi:hypothetical protein
MTKTALPCRFPYRKRHFATHRAKPPQATVLPTTAPPTAPGARAPQKPPPP